MLDVCKSNTWVSSYHSWFLMHLKSNPTHPLNLISMLHLNGCLQILSFHNFEQLKVSWLDGFLWFCGAKYTGWLQIGIAPKGRSATGAPGLPSCICSQRSGIASGSRVAGSPPKMMECQHRKVGTRDLKNIADIFQNSLRSVLWLYELLYIALLFSYMKIRHLGRWPHFCCSPPFHRRCKLRSKQQQFAAGCFGLGKKHANMPIWQLYVAKKLLVRF